jgi:hypothetical protein
MMEILGNLRPPFLLNQHPTSSMFSFFKSELFDTSVADGVLHKSLKLRYDFCAGLVRRVGIQE